MMKTVKPILFSAPMIRAILEGRKTQTRRILKGSTEHKGKYNPAYLERHKNDPGWKKICPYGKPGDLLWVRETFRSNKKHFVGYRADGSCGVFFQNGAGGRYFLKHGQMAGGGCPPKNGRQYGISKYGDCWKSSIHMPRWANRITLEIKDIRVEKLNDISGSDAKEEGTTVCTALDILGDYYNSGEDQKYIVAFRDLWQSINGPKSWDENPWVWVIEFEAHQCNIDDYLKQERKKDDS